MLFRSLDPESPVLARYVTGSLPSVEIRRRELESGSWVERLPALLAHGRGKVVSNELTHFLSKCQVVCVGFRHAARPPYALELV